MSEEAVIRRITAVAMIVAGILLLVGVGLTPRADDPASVVSVLTAYAEDESLATFGIVSGTAGIWVLVLGFANVHHFIGFGAGAAWGRIGFYSLIISASAMTAAGGLSLGVVESAASVVAGDVGSLDGLVIVSQNMQEYASVGLWTSLILTGIAWTRTDVYPKWASWSLLILAAASTMLASARVTSERSEGLEILVVAGVAIVGVWAIAAGAWLARKGW